MMAAAATICMVHLLKIKLKCNVALLCECDCPTGPVDCRPMDTLMKKFYGERWAMNSPNRRFFVRVYIVSRARSLHGVSALLAMVKGWLARSSTVADGVHQFRRVHARRHAATPSGRAQYAG
jgi:hypothetical protein